MPPLIKSHYRVTRHVVSSVYELACTLMVTHRRARRLAMYRPAMIPNLNPARAVAIPF
ncbi:MAG TPA: hypothetical protein VI072_09780 [Polyangiaceae bacterium]